MFRNVKPGWIIYSTAAVKLLVHLLTMHNYGLQRDAYLYYSLGEHLDWGFVSVPPFIGLISNLSTTLFGNTVFALRIFPALVGSLSVIILGKLVRELKGGNMAILIACLAFLLSPAFMRTNLLFQPVAFNQFFWLLSVFFLVKMINSGDPKGWFPLMLTWGIAFQNKYSITFVILATLISLLLTPHRKLLFSKKFLFAGMIGLAIILPNILWQYFHNWPVSYHMKELQSSQFVNVSIIGFIIDQLVQNFPGIIVWITGLALFLLKNEWKKYRVLAFIYLFTLLIIISFNGKGYYTLGLYSMLFAMGGVAIEKYFNRPGIIFTLSMIVAFFALMIPGSLPVLSYEKLEKWTKPVAPVLNRWEDGNVYAIPQDFADMTGWDELGEKVTDFYLSLDPETREQCLVYGDNYGHAGAINFYGKKHGLTGAICFSDNFILWAPDTISKVPMIYVNHDIGDVDKLYHNVREVGRINNRYFRENGLRIYFCENPTDLLQPFYAEKVSARKARYQR